MPLSVSLWNDLGDLLFGGVGLAGFKSRDNAFLLAKDASSPVSSFTVRFSPISF